MTYCINQKGLLKKYENFSLDTADTGRIEEYYVTGLIDGVTTNPTLIMKAGEILTMHINILKMLVFKDIVWKSWVMKVRCILK